MHALPTETGRRVTTRSAMLVVLIIACTGLAAGLAAGLGGCTAWATYPPLPGSVGLHNPDLAPIPELMARAIEHAYTADRAADGAAEGAEGEIIFNLPPQTPASIYDKVSERLVDKWGTGARPMREAGERAYHVMQVRVRTIESEVDLIRRDAAGVPEEMTISFKQVFAGHRVTDVRLWRYRVAEPGPNYNVPSTLEEGSLSAADDR